MCLSRHFLTELYVQVSGSVPTMCFSAGIAVEAYGANISGSMQLDENSENSANSVTLNLRRSYVSEPLLFADPITNKEVKLTKTAKKLLEEQGPEAFTKRYGTHFIAGYTIGTSIPCLFLKC